MIREIASRLYPGLITSGQTTFKKLVGQAEAADGLESRYRRLFDSDSIDELFENGKVASQLSLKHMAAGEYTIAEEVLTEYAGRLVEVREQARSSSG